MKYIIEPSRTSKEKAHILLQLLVEKDMSLDCFAID
jgi:hypothetical protein